MLRTSASPRWGTPHASCAIGSPPRGLLWLVAAALLLASSAAQATPVMLDVVDATDPALHIASYRYLINLDDTGDVTQPRAPACTPADLAYPAGCAWPSVQAISQLQRHRHPGRPARLRPGPRPPAGALPHLGPCRRLQARRHALHRDRRGDRAGPGAPPAPPPADCHHPGAGVRGRLHSERGAGPPGRARPGRLPGLHHRLPGPRHHRHLRPTRSAPSTTRRRASPSPARAASASPGASTPPAPTSPPRPTPTASARSAPQGILTIPNVGPNRYALSVVPPNGTTWIQTPPRSRATSTSTPG